MKRVNLLTLLFAVLIALTPSQALADIGGLTKCSESAAFTKRLNASVKKLEQRASQYEADSPPALALKQQIERTQARFDKYSRSELLCGTDGLPHLITDGRLDFSKSVFDKFFNLEIPLNVDGLENDFLVPHFSWDNLEEYFSTGNMLTRLFKNNFEKFKIQDSDILAAGPKTDLSA